MEPKVIFEDDSILVIDKPAGMTVNTADTTKGEETLQDWLERKFPISKFQFPIDQDSDFFKRHGIVHRLDKETSGVLIAAKTPEAFVDLQRQFKERLVAKTYVALVHGEVVPEEGEISVPVGRLPWNRKRFGIVAEGRESSTSYKVLNYYELNTDNYTLLELRPKTGRTHQIRVHLKYLNYPIVSDALYGGRKRARNDRKKLSRMFLHAKAISFTHPKTAKPFSIEAQIPSDLQTFLNLCKELS